MFFFVLLNNVISESVGTVADSADDVHVNVYLAASSSVSTLDQLCLTYFLVAHTESHMYKSTNNQAHTQNNNNNHTQTHSRTEILETSYRFRSMLERLISFSLKRFFLLYFCFVFFIFFRYIFLKFG